MNLSILQSEVKTMSSREIATLCDKRHDNVCNDIRVLNETYEKMGLLKIKDTLYINEQNGQQYREYLLTKEQSIDLVTGYNRELRIAINRRWQELEAQQSVIALPQDYETALEHLLIQVKQNKQLAIENAELKPKANALDRISHAKGNQNVRDTAKAINVNQNGFVSWCLDHDWLYRDDASRLKAYQHRINQGFMAQKSVVYEGTDGTERVTMQPMFTPKGITHLAKIHQSKEVA